MVRKKKITKVRVTLVKSPIGYSVRQKSTLKALGLTRMFKVVEHAVNDPILGMLNKISHLIEVEEV